MQTFLVLLVVQGEVGDAYFTDPHTHTHTRSPVFLRRGWGQINKFNGPLLGVSAVLASTEKTQREKTLQKSM